MSKLQSLLEVLLSDMSKKERKTIEDSVLNCICTNIIQGVKPNEIELSRTKIIDEDKHRFYVKIGMKSNKDLIVPLDKRYQRNVRLCKNLNKILVCNQ